MADIDMDIEMDLDIGITEEDIMIPEVDIIPDAEGVTQQDATPILTHPNDNNEPDSLEPTPHKVHLRGLDNLTTKDIKAFASEYYAAHHPSRVEWIDDTSANLVYDNADIAQEALIAFASMEIADVSQIPALQTLPAKSFPLHPDTNLQVRLAVAGDRKQAGASKFSRFYLLNPEYDPSERRKRGGYRGGRSYRDRDDGGYRSQRYDDREQRKREQESEFDASLYDDDEVAVANRAARRHDRRDSSSGGSGDRSQRRVRSRGDRELFPERGYRSGGGGRLRDRSASPARDKDFDRDAAKMKRQDEVAAENRLKAQAIKARLRDAQVPKELFPQKTSPSHRRSGAFDAADETADLFAHKMPVPFTDGSSDSRPTLASRITSKTPDNDIGFSIRGAAKAFPAATQTFSIKGAASGARVKELFPSTFGENAGKELFSETLEGRGRRRQKAEDLFY